MKRCYNILLYFVLQHAVSVFFWSCAFRELAISLITSLEPTWMEEKCSTVLYQYAHYWDNNYDKISSIFVHLLSWTG